MNQIAKMLMDSNGIKKRILERSIPLEEVDRFQRQMEIEVKILNVVIAAFGVHSKNRRAMASLEKMNLLDDTTAIDLGLGDPNEDMVKCPDKGKLITRAECLDYSGDHVEDCLGCETGASTKNKVLGPKV